MKPAPAALIRSTEAAWDRAAAKYAFAVAADIEFLRGGGVSLCDIERSMLGDLHGCGRAIHLQCSYGLDALSLPYHSPWAPTNQKRSRRCGGSASSPPNPSAPPEAAAPRRTS